MCDLCSSSRLRPPGSGRRCCTPLLYEAFLTSPRWTDEVDVDDEYERYHEHVRSAAASGLFDILAHIDAIKARAPHMPTAPERAWMATVEAVRAADVAVEVNTAGLRKCGEPFPAWGLVAQLHSAGVPLTFGSDAHAPDEVAYGWAGFGAG